YVFFCALLLSFVLSVSVLLYFDTNFDKHCLPSRRSSDLAAPGADRGGRRPRDARDPCGPSYRPCTSRQAAKWQAGTGHESWPRRDRKSTRLNSSHVKSSYAVFCLKKKKKTKNYKSRSTTQ